MVLKAVTVLRVIKAAQRLGFTLTRQASSGNLDPSWRWSVTSIALSPMFDVEYL